MLTFFWRTSISSVAQCTLWSCRCSWYPAGWCRANLHVSKRGYCQVRFIGVSVSPKCYVLCNAMENLGSHSQREACGREMWGPPAEPKELRTQDSYLSGSGFSKGPKSTGFIPSSPMALCPHLYYSTNDLVWGLLAP